MSLFIIHIPPHGSYGHMLRLFNSELEARRFSKRMAEEHGVDCDTVRGTWADVPKYLSFG